MRLQSLLKALIEGVAEDQEEKSEVKIKMTREEQAEFYKQFLENDPTTFRQGDFVHLNKFGEDQYIQPREDTIAVVTDVFPPMRNRDNDEIVNGQIMVVFKHKHGEKGEHTHAARFLVDLRFYEKVQ